MAMMPLWGVLNLLTEMNSSRKQAMGVNSEGGQYFSSACVGIVAGGSVSKTALHSALLNTLPC